MLNGPVEIQLGDLETYTIDQPSASLDVLYNWTYLGDTICQGCTEVTIPIDESGELCVESLYGADCSDITCLSIVAIDAIEIYIPNVFSPNGDQVNDRFLFQSNTENTMIESMAIYDRWGSRRQEALP